MGKRRKAKPASDPGPGGAGDVTPAGEPQETQEEIPEDADTQGMAHVSRDLLAGSPDVFADAPAEPASAPEPAQAAEPQPEAEPDAAVADTSTGAAAEEAPAAEVVKAAAEQPVAMEAAPAAAAPAPPPPSATATRVSTAVQRSSRSSVAFGVVLVVVGIFALAVVVFGVDLTQYGWPLFVIVPGLTLIIVGFFGLGNGASIPGGMITMLGLVLAYQSATGDWASWAFIWTLITPFGVGMGMYLQSMRDRDPGALRRGRTLMVIGLVMFLVGFVFFESILGISGDIYGWFGKGALPILLIIGGLVLLVRNAQRSRSA